MPARPLHAFLILGLALAGSPAAAQQASPDPAAPASPAPSQPAPPPAPTPPASPPAPADQPQAQQPQPAQPQGIPATVLSPEESEGIIGKSVRSAAGEDMGRIVDVIVTTGTQPRAAVIDFGGFLGVGSRKIAVDWRLLQYSRNGKTWAVTVALNRNQLRVSPEYKPGEPVVVLGMPSPPAAAVPVAAAPAAPPPAATPAGSAPPAASPPPTTPASPPSAAPAGDPPAAQPEGPADAARPSQK